MKKSILINLAFLCFFQTTFGQCQEYLDSMIRSSAEGTLIHSRKLLPKKVRRIFEDQIIKSKVDFTDYSDLHKFNYQSKHKPLVFLFCTITKGNEVIMAIYDRTGLASAGFYYFFTYDDKGKVTDLCSIRKIEMICDWKRLKLIVKNKEYDL